MVRILNFLSCHKTANISLIAKIPAFHDINFYKKWIAVNPTMKPRTEPLPGCPFGCIVMQPAFAQKTRYNHTFNTGTTEMKSILKYHRPAWNFVKQVILLRFVNFIRFTVLNALKTSCRGELKSRYEIINV